MTCVVVTPGEPAGIGPDCVIRTAQRAWTSPWVAVADPECLRARARLCDLPLTVVELSDISEHPHIQPARTLYCLPVPLNAPCIAGQLEPANADYVLRCLQTATSHCQQQRASALVTGPVNKALINQAGYPFSGHTEWLAQQTNTAEVVMLLACQRMRVALVTTHLPLRHVADAITQEKCVSTIKIVDTAFRRYFTTDRPRIHVLGLNPHAGEGGHLGDEEIKHIAPAIEACRAQGIDVFGPYSADTAFTDEHCQQADVFIAMFHDQGLPVIKQAGFGEIVNITLGLPIIRTSVDHGTAHQLAGSNKVNASSLEHAILQAQAMAAPALVTA